MYIHSFIIKMYSIGIVVTVLIGGLIATTVASNDDSLLCYLQKLDGKLDNMESKLDTLQKQCCKATTGGNGDGKPKPKPKRTCDPSAIGSSPKKTITGFNMPWNIFITDDGIAYLPEYGGQKLRKLDKDGNKLKEVSFPGQPTSVNVHGNEVYVTDMQNNKIRRYTKDLSPISSKDFNSPGPVSLAVDSSGIIYVSEYFQGKVNIYQDDGSRTGGIDFAISHPNKYLRNIRFDAKENLFGSSYFESSILTYTKAGTLVNKFTISGVTYTNGPFIDGNGNIYVADFSNGMVYILNSSGTVIKSFNSAAQSASDIALAPDGTLWILDYYRGQIHLYSC